MITVFIVAFEAVEEETSVHPDWLLEVPEELDVCVAQRHFEEALALLHKAKEYILQNKDNQSDHTLADIERKVTKKKAVNILYIPHPYFLSLVQFERSRVKLF